MGLFTVQPVSLLTKQDKDPSYLQNPQPGNDSWTLQNQIKFILARMRGSLPQPNQVIIRDPSGKMIAWLGYQQVGTTIYQSLWANQAYFGGNDPTSAGITVAGGQINLGTPPTQIQISGSQIRIGTGTQNILLTSSALTVSNAKILLTGGPLNNLTILIDPATFQISVSNSIDHSSSTIQSFSMVVVGSGGTTTGQLAGGLCSISGASAHFQVNSSIGVTKTINPSTTTSMGITGGIITSTTP